MSKISKKGNNSKIIKKFFFQNFTKYFSHHPLSADTSFKFLSLILFEIWHLQNFISIFSKGRNFTRGDNSKKEKYVSAIYKILSPCLSKGRNLTRGDNSGKTRNMRRLFFHEESIHEVSRRYLHAPYTHTYTRTSRNQYVPHFFKVGGIKMINTGYKC